MKILIMAAGAVGGYYGSLLARADNDVVFVARGDNLDAIRRDGLRVNSVNSGDFTLRVNAVASLDGSWTADLVMFCVKGYQNALAIETIAPAVADDTTILTLQNGIGAGSDLSAAFGADKVLLGAAYVDAAHPKPGVFDELGGTCRIVFAEQDGPPSARCSEILATLQSAGIESEIAADINEALWNKLVYICGLSGMTCITRSSFKEVMETPQTADLTLAVLEEAATVGQSRRRQPSGRRGRDHHGPPLRRKGRPRLIHVRRPGRRQAPRTRQPERQGIRTWPRTRRPNPAQRLHNRLPHPRPQPRRLRRLNEGRRDEY